MPSATRLAVVATYDAGGRLWPHVRHQIETYAAVAEVIVVSAGGLRPDDLAWARARARVVERDNAGYDFASYRAGLDEAGDLGRFELVLVANDSFVGPVLPLEQIIDEMATRRVDFWGLTRNAEQGDHLQSYFVAFTPAALGSEAFASFWSDFEPLDDRDEVISRYEVGLTSRLAGAGLSYDAYFVPRAREHGLARARRSWMSVNLSLDPENDPRPVPVPGSTEEWNRVRTVGVLPANPCITLADSVLDGGRLPIVKIETLRDDPYALDADVLLRRCEREYPDAFTGVRDYLDETREARGRRLTTIGSLSDERRLDGRTLAYGTDLGPAGAGLRPSNRFASEPGEGENTASAQIAALVGSDPGGTAPRVLEVGCWTGATGRRLTDQGCRVTGVEADPEAAARARSGLADVVLADPVTTPLTDLFAPGSFDVVVLAEILEYVADPGAVLEAACALLTADGRVVVSTPNATHGSRRLALLQGRWSEAPLPADRPPLRTFDRGGLLRLVTDAGLVPTALRGTIADPMVSAVGVPQKSLPYAVGEWVRDRPDAMVESFQLAARAAVPGEVPTPVDELELVPAVPPETVRLTDAHTERAALIRTERRAGRRLPKRVAQLEEQVRRLEAELARNPLRRAAGQLRRRIR